MVPCGHLGGRWAWPGPEANSLSVASGTLPVAIWNRLEILNNLPQALFCFWKTEVI